MSHQFDISVVMCNYNGADFITECLDALFSSKLKATFEVLMVDNASTDNSLTVMAPYLDRMTLIQNERNEGFAYANNQGFDIAQGKYFFLLNTDAIVEEDAIQKMLDYYEAHPETGAIAPQLTNADGSLQCPGSSLGHWRFKQGRTRKVPFIAGAAVLITKEMMDAQHGMDENLFFYNDDIDMSRFLRIRKIPIIYLPVAIVKHYGGLSSNKRRVGSLIEGYRGGIYLAYKHYGQLAGVLYRVFLLLILLPQTLIIIVKMPFSAVCRELIKGYLSVFLIILTNDIYLERVKIKKEK